MGSKSTCLVQFYLVVILALHLDLISMLLRWKLDFSYANKMRKLNSTWAWIHCKQSVCAFIMTFCMAIAAREKQVRKMSDRNFLLVFNVDDNRVWVNWCLCRFQVNFAAAVSYTHKHTPDNDRIDDWKLRTLNANHLWKWNVHEIRWSFAIIWCLHLHIISIVDSCRWSTIYLWKPLDKSGESHQNVHMNIENWTDPNGNKLTRNVPPLNFVFFISFGKYK